ncbi:MAG: hypothetical protein KDD53_04365, partial [Bdellovibrionales bacterium]|nr:hypothetical protein [Bdellovibrionales bacterium]
GDGTVYITTFGANSASAGVYQSTDNGANFTRKLSGAGDSASYNIRGAAFAGAIHFIGRYVSTDGGSTFEQTATATLDTPLSLNMTALLIDGTDTDKALGSSELGPIYTENLSAGSSANFTERFKGMRGIIVSDMDQSSDLGVTVLALQGGIARSLNFATASEDPNTKVIYEFPLYPTIGSNVQTGPVFSVAIDKDDSNRVYVGSGTLYVGDFDESSNVTWQDVTSISDPGFNIYSIELSDSSIFVGFARTSGGIDGKVLVLDRSTFAEKSVGLQGKPVSALAVISESVVYAGVGGRDTIEDNGRLEENRGLYRSLDGGITWSKIQGEQDLEIAGIASMSYDSEKNILYIAGNGFDQDIDDDEEDDDIDDEDDQDEDQDDELIGSDLDQSGTVFTITNPSSTNLKIRRASIGLPKDQQISAVTVASKDGTSRAFASSNNIIYESNSSGTGWAVLYKGPDNDESGLLFFDGLVSGSKSGFSGFSGKPAGSVTSLTKSVSSSSKKSIDVRFSKTISKSKSNLNKLKVRGAIAKIKKKNAQTLSILPAGTWSQSAKKRVRIVLKPTFSMKGGEKVDNDYDGEQGGGVFKRVVKVKKK